MCASYAAPSESVSTRMIVAPGTAALAAAVTFDAAVPVSKVSPGPCVIFAGSTAPWGAWAAATAAADVPDEPVLDEPVAAPATCAPARIPPATRPLASRPIGASRRRHGR